MLCVILNCKTHENQAVVSDIMKQKRRKQEKWRKWVSKWRGIKEMNESIQRTKGIEQENAEEDRKRVRAWTGMKDMSKQMKTNKGYKW